MLKRQISNLYGKVFHFYKKYTCAGFSEFCELQMSQTLSGGRGDLSSIASLSEAQVATWTCDCRLQLGVVLQGCL